MCRQWGGKKLHFLHVPRERNTWADYLANAAFEQRAQVSLEGLGVWPPLSESAPRLVKPRTRGNQEQTTQR